MIINLLNYNDHWLTNEFWDSLASNSFISYILKPTWITSHSKTLIDNIFSNTTCHEVISGKISATISDQLPQFVFVPNALSKDSCQKSNWLGYLDKDWSDVLQLDQQDVNLSIESFLGNMNSMLDKHAPLKLTNKNKLKFKSKPWITPSIQTSITVKNNLLKRFINAKDSKTKETFHRQYKDYRNMLSTLLKKVNQIIKINISEPIRTILKILTKE